MPAPHDEPEVFEEVMVDGEKCKVPPLCTRVQELGGLHIIGSERHDSRRIDNQLRGRAGRQGDPGSSRFYLSLEDDLMRLFSSGREPRKEAIFSRILAWRKKALPFVPFIGRKTSTRRRSCKGCSRDSGKFPALFPSSFLCTLGPSPGWSNSG